MHLLSVQSKYKYARAFKKSKNCRIVLDCFRGWSNNLASWDQLSRNPRTVRVLRDSAAASAPRKLFYVTLALKLENRPDANAASRRWSSLWFRAFTALRKSDSVAIGFLRPVCGRPRNFGAPIITPRVPFSPTFRLPSLRSNFRIFSEFQRSRSRFWYVLGNIESKKKKKKRERMFFFSLLFSNFNRELRSG